MKYLIPVSFLIGGLAIGYVVGINAIDTSEKSQSIGTDSITTQLVYDTVFTKEIVKVAVEVEPEVIEIDSLLADSMTNELIVLDTLSESFIEKSDDTLIELTDDGVKINKDKKIASAKVNIIYLQQLADDDSLIKSALKIHEVQNKVMIIEFWESPINYSGYKLSKSKVIVYGLSPQFEYKMYKKESAYYLNFQSIFYKMVETNQFSPFLQIDKSEVIDD